MNICDAKGHEDIVYEARHCPMCALIDESAVTIEQLCNEIKDLEYVVADLEKEIASQSKLFE